MQTVWITPPPHDTAARTFGRRSVIVFAAGWAGSDALVRHLVLPGDTDLVCLFDYRTLPSSAETAELYARLEPYAERHLVAWSFGVWAAERTFGGGATGFWTTATAINGTPVPVHDSYGIPERAFGVTVRSIGGAGIVRFLERMCGTPDVLKEYYRHRSTRPLEEIYDELLQLQRRVLGDAAQMSSPFAPGFWTSAVVGGRDAIFPPENMIRYWTPAGVPVTVIDEMPHYPLAEAGILNRLIHETR